MSWHIIATVPVHERPSTKYMGTPTRLHAQHTCIHRAPCPLTEAILDTLTMRDPSVQTQGQGIWGGVPPSLKGKK
eukprot:5384909-Pyramimonas_sp.AAC.1